MKENQPATAPTAEKRIKFLLDCDEKLTGIPNSESSKPELNEQALTGTLIR